MKVENIQPTSRFHYLIEITSNFISNNSFANYIFKSPSSLPSPFGLPEPEDKRASFFETSVTLYQWTEVTFTEYLNSSNTAVRT